MIIKGTTTLKTLKRGQYAKYADELFFLGLGDGVAFKFTKFGKCTRTDIDEETYSYIKFELTIKKDFESALSMCRHKDDLFSMFCADAALRFKYSYAY